MRRSIAVALLTGALLVGFAPAAHAGGEEGGQGVCEVAAYTYEWVFQRPAPFGCTY